LEYFSFREITDGLWLLAFGLTVLVGLSICERLAQWWSIQADRKGVAGGVCAEELGLVLETAMLCAYALVVVLVVSALSAREMTVNALVLACLTLPGIFANTLILHREPVLPRR
jgi:hypothetical protein